MSDLQKGVDDMALAISAAETRCEAALIDAGALAGKIKRFRKECDLHVTVTAEAQAKAASAASLIGDGLSLLKSTHDELERIRCEKMLDIMPQGGGGGK